MTTEEIEKAAEDYSKEYWREVSEMTNVEESIIYSMDNFKAGVEFADKHWQEKTRWIPVEERLPEYHGLDSKEYLVKLSVGSISPKISYTTSRLRNEHRWSCETDWRYVTHWKEIE